ncbi:MAG: hypothetical protein AAB824_00100, partial [Patescibacteria group bacterium]
MDAKRAKLVSLMDRILKLVDDDKRDAKEVCRILQIIRSDRNFTECLLSDRVFEKIFKDDISPVALPAILTQPDWAIELVEDAEFPFAMRGGLILDLVDFLLPEEKYIPEEKPIRGELAISRSRKKGYLAGGRALTFLMHHPKYIPEDWRKFNLIFPGTIWCDSKHRKGVQYMYWHAGRWRMNYCWLTDDFSAIVRVVRIQKPSKKA